MRREPYTALGIGRVPCQRCGAPSHQQWAVCANDNLFMGVCLRCDMKLNRMVLRFFGFDDEVGIMARYKERFVHA